MLFRQDNASVHTSIITVGKINELKLEFLPQAPYAPDLASANYCPFTNLKKRVRDKRIVNNGVEFAVDVYIEELDPRYKQGVEVIRHRWEKYIELEH